MPLLTKKTCKHCGETKPIAEFKMFKAFIGAVHSTLAAGDNNLSDGGPPNAVIN